MQTEGGQNRGQEALRTRLGWAIRVATAVPVADRFPYSGVRIERSARRRLRSAIEHAYRFVPHYRETFDALGLRPDDIASAADLGRLPILERVDLQTDPERFVSTRLPRERLIRLRTGGSSGGPLAIYHDAGALFERAAHRGRRRGMLMREAGRRLRLREVSFGTAHSSSRMISRELSRRSLVPRGIRIVTEAYSMLDPLEENVRRIERFEPHVVAGYGSYLEALMDHVEDRGGTSHLPAAFVYGGDAMSERGRRMIAQRFGVPVYTAYGSVEAPDLGFDCEAHRGIHINSDLYPVRIVDRDGHEVPAGSSGELVVSNLVNRGTVLLSYRLGDVARWIPGPCTCGRRLPLLSYIEGRTDDWLELADGGLLHPQGLRELFTEEDQSVRRYQIEQRSPSDYLVRVVPAPRLDQRGRRELADRLAARIRAVTGAGTAVEFEFVEEVPRTAMGKVRTVLSAGSRRRSAAVGGCEVRPARPGELEAILAVMQPANMHRLDSPEMPELDLERFFVAELDGEVVGAAGWTLLESGLAKTTLLAVRPAARGAGVGAALQRARMEAMAQAGARRVRTNADRPETIEWYKREFGYEEVGRLAKVDRFGDPDVEEWTTLEAPLPLPSSPPAHRERGDEVPGQGAGR